MADYEDMADRFQEASTGFARALRSVGGDVSQLMSANGHAAEGLAALKKEIDGLKKPEVAKWVAVAVSLLSLGLSAWSASNAYRNGKLVGQLEVLHLINELADIPRASTPTSGSSPATPSAPASQHYFSIANQIQVKVEADGFSQVDVNNFVSLMQATLAFRDLRHAERWWAREATVKDFADAGPGDRVQLAMLYADFARLEKSPERLRDSAIKLHGAAADVRVTATERFFAAVSLTTVYASIRPASAEDVKSWRDSFEYAQRLLADLKVADPAVGAEYEAQYASQMSALGVQLEAVEKERKARRPPRATTTTGASHFTAGASL